MFDAVGKVILIYRCGQCTYSCFHSTSTFYQCSLPLAALPYSHRRSNEQRKERNDSCRIDYYQSLERIPSEPGIEPATSCSRFLQFTTELHAFSLNRRVTYINSCQTDCNRAEHLQILKIPIFCGSPPPIHSLNGL